MTLVAHIFILASYVLAALAVAVGLPDAIPGIGAPLAYVIGALVFVVSALMHEVFYRRSERLDLVEDVYDLREALAQTVTEVHALSHDAARVQSQLEQAEQRAGRQSELIAEMQVLQTLLEQMAEHRAVGGGERLRAVAGGGAVHQTPRARKGRLRRGGREGEVISLESSRPGRDVTASRRPREGIRKDLGINEIDDILRRALQENRVDLYLQPVVSLPQRKVRFYEALSRIRDAGGAVIAPEQYMPVAESTGLITTIDNLLLFRCVQLIRRVRKRRMDVGFFVNVSPYTLDDSFFFAQFVEFMEQNRELADHLIFEFSQEAMSRHSSEVESSLLELAEMGFRFSVDQVTSLDLDLADLARRRVAFIKVDAARLASNLGSAETPISIYKLKGDLARTGIDLIAEKVEEEDLVTELVDYNVDFGQGYLFGEPRPAR